MTIYNREDPRTALPQLEKELNKQIDDVRESIDERIDNIAKNLLPTNLFAVTIHDSSTMTTASETNVTNSINGTKAGYYPLGVIGFHYTYTSGSTAHINMYSMYIYSRSNGSFSLTFSARNRYSASTVWSLRVYVLWAKI